MTKRKKEVIPKKVGSSVAELLVARTNGRRITYAQNIAMITGVKDCRKAGLFKHC
jgi:hypothetical protein